MIVLSVRGLKKSFDGVSAVREVSFDLREAEMLALIGPNGAGKTTCFNLINGQLRPDAGSVTFLGNEILGLRPRHIWRLGVSRTFQVAAVFSSMTLLQNIQVVLASQRRELGVFWRLANGLNRSDALAILEKVGMADQAERQCGEFAYGDLKRVDLALAIGSSPKLLLMDEPTAGMAPNERLELMRLTAAIVREHKISVLFTEHDMDIVFDHADRVIVMHRGALIAEGPPTSVRKDERVQQVYLGLYERDAEGGR